MGLLVAGQIALVAAGIWATMHLRRDSNLERWKTAEAILKHTPPDAVIVTGLPPAYLENYPGMKHRSIIPLSRNVEYASKVLVMSKIHDLSVQPAGWWDTRSPELIASGAEEVIPWVALDHPDRLVNFLMEGRRVYVDRETVPQWHVDGIARSLNLLLRDNGKKLFELSLPAE